MLDPAQPVANRIKLDLQMGRKFSVAELIAAQPQHCAMCFILARLKIAQLTFDPVERGLKALHML
jgi:hypothetical protein